MTTYPGEFEIHVATHAKTLWEHNPYIASINSRHREPNGVEKVTLHYGHYISQANQQKLHFITAFHRDFAKRFGLQVPVLQAKGDLYVPKHQALESPISDRYWIIVPGHKSDFTTKAWSFQRWQQLVYKLRRRGLKLVQVGANNSGHTNPKLDGVLSLVGQTNLRDVCWLMKHCEGVICPITCFMHMAAAFDKPCVCIAGGREHWWWEAYVNVAGVEHFGPYSQPVTVPHRFLHTQGLLDCCLDRGCWKNKILHTQKDKNRSYCSKPVDDGYGQTIPKCLQMITVEHVVEAVMSYYKGDSLPPIGNPREIPVPDADPPPRKALMPKNIDLFAPADQILGSIAENTQDTSVPKLVKAFQSQQKPAQKQLEVRDNPFANPIIGGPMTICVLMYGDYPDMHRACLGSIFQTTAPELRELRIVTNQLALPTRNWLDGLKAEGQLHTLIHNDDNRKKYPAMRQLFWDPDNPITTKWIVWFDDDTIANRDTDWHKHLAQKIIAEYPKKARMVGDLRFFTLTASQREWAKTRPWWRDRHLQTKQKTAAPNGQHIFFAAGGFWALEAAAMREAMIPDEQIGHNGGDYILGLQLWQQGYRTAAWNTGKKHVHTSSVGRRGLNEIHTGMPQWRPGGVPKNRQTVV